ncbi:MAG: hypothetical protein KF910_01740 [Brevundimonas sp.]|uniref:hypothetical protein n=1 Tax=Brevundimonas sp. TaxID=1871086 RepID=UPI0025C27780|nr:hypothetical protein [Brevundimonas sp.]MBX3476305.1 hypothetical protein [Brevundimonas sp.]
MGGWRIGVAVAVGLLAGTPALAQEQATYRYDAFGRLVAVGRAVTGAAGSVTTYGNDDADNRLSRGTTTTPLPIMGFVLHPNEILVPTQRLVSQDGRFNFRLQVDGNIVLYFGTTPLWATNTVNGQGLYVKMEPTGNLVAYASDGSVVWASGTAGHPGALLVIQDNGDAVIYDGSTPIWATNTCCH